MTTVWVSCGAASAAAAVVALERFNDVVLVNNPILQEHEDNRRFLADLSRVLGVPIHSAVHPDYPTGDCSKVWSDRGYMSDRYGAPCTMLLKRKARHLWEERNGTGALVLGFSADEKERADRFKRYERAELVPVLIDAKLSRQDCAALVVRRFGVRLPVVYSMGLPNANCIGCVKASSATYWNLIRKLFPDAFRERAEQSRALGARLAEWRGRRWFLDELPPTAYGRPLNTLRPIGCELFCEL